MGKKAPNKICGNRPLRQNQKKSKNRQVRVINTQGQGKRPNLLLILSFPEISEAHYFSLGRIQKRESL